MRNYVKCLKKPQPIQQPKVLQHVEKRGSLTELQLRQFKTLGFVKKKSKNRDNEMLIYNEWVARIKNSKEKRSYSQADFLFVCFLFLPTALESSTASFKY